MKTWNLHIIIGVLLLFAGCKHMPTAVEGDANLQVRVVDASGIMKSVYGDSLVRSATVTIKSIRYGSTYTASTDTNGVVAFSGLLSDKYTVVVSRVISGAEMQVATGSTAQRKLFGGISSVQAHADVATTVATATVSLAPESGIVISEIYACGPVGSGLYFHDKYVEVCNISDSVQYLDGLVIARVNKGYVAEPLIYSKTVWKFPGSGKEYPIQPGQFVVAAEDAIDHRVSAPNSVDLSNADFEFYRASQPDVDNTAVPNMIEIYQTSGVDWLIGGEKDALVLCRVPSLDSLKYSGDFLTISKDYVIDGVEYNTDPTAVDQKILDSKIDAGMTGGILFYTGYSMERKMISASNVLGWTLKDDNNSSLDFDIIKPPTPKTHHAL